jgi:hypothetical protein
LHHLIYVSADTVRGIGKTADQLEAVGLADHAVAGLPDTIECDGPDGKFGTLYGWRKHGLGRLHFDPAAQTWIPAAAQGDLPPARYWVGLWNESPPTEQDVKRAYQFGGKRVELGDGARWVIPLPHELPHEVRLRDDGSWQFVIQRRFHDYHLRCAEYVERIEADRGGVTMAEMLRHAVEALIINYRLTPEVINHLNLFSHPEAGAQKVVGLAFVASLGLDAGE